MIVQRVKKKVPLSTLYLVRVELDLNLLNKVFGSSFMDEKNMVGRKDSIKGGQLDSSAINVYFYNMT